MMDPTCPRCRQPIRSHVSGTGDCIDGQPPDSEEPFAYLITSARPPAESFADAPSTVGELRAHRDGTGSAWSPRDVLVNLLREIDSGQIKPTAMVLTMSVETADGGIGHAYRNATPNNFVALGLLSRCAFRLQES